MKFTSLLTCLFIASFANAQNNNHPDTVIDGKTYSYVEQMPASGYDLGKYLSENIHYPDTAIKSNIEGKVIVKFVVNENGKISNCTIVKGISKECDEEAIRVVKTMPAWRPGVQNGLPVKVYFTLPIVYKLTD